MLAVVATTPDIRLRCLLSGGQSQDAGAGAKAGATASSQPLQGVVLRQADVPDSANGLAADGPAAGDLLVELAGVPTPTFLDFSAALFRPKGAAMLPGSSLNPHADPRLLGDETPIWLVEQNGRRLVRARFCPRLQDGSYGPPRTAWLRLGPTAPLRLTLTIAWLLTTGLLFALAWLAYQRRPQDIANRQFLVLSTVTLVAIVGGSHWWLLAARPWLAAPFLGAALLLPAVLLHFVILFPRPPERVAPWRWVLVYGPAVLMTLGVVGLAGLAWLVNEGVADGAIGEARAAIEPDESAGPVDAADGSTIGSTIGSTVGGVGTANAAPGESRDELAIRGVDWMLSLLRVALFGYAFVAAGYYAISLGLLWRTMRRTPNPQERRHVRWLLTAAAVAAVPVLYTLGVGLLDRSRLALGNAQLALFCVSLLLGGGYVAGLIALRRVLVDEVADRGLMWSVLSLAASLLLAVVVAVASIAVRSGVAPGTGSPTLATLTLTAAVLMAWWVRGKVQAVIDARYGEMRFDFALSRLRLGAIRSVGRGDSASDHAGGELARQALDSCRDMIGVTEAAFLQRADDAGDEQGHGSDVRFEAVACLDRPSPPAVTISRDVLDELAAIGTGESDGALIQLAPGGRAEFRTLLQTIAAGAVQPVVVEGRVVALLALGPIAGPITRGGALTSEDAADLVGLARMTATAIEAAAVDRRLLLLGEELHTRLQQLDAQQRRIRELEGELAAVSRQDDLRASAGSEPPGSIAGIRGSSPAIRSVLATVAKVAPSQASVLVRGESGTGKELLARAIHERSDRAAGPLISVNCAALSPGLLESELFGHVKGAFTDARADKPGRFELAHGGTLFFDEVGDIPLPVQVKLLRVLQERRFERVGSAESQPTDVRVVAATHQDLGRLIAEGRFREDLYYRLNVVTVTLPPLRERREDILELATHFLAELAADGGESRGEPVRLDAAAMAALETYDWPGNVRQLRNVIERALVLSDGVCIRREDLPPDLPPDRAADRTPDRTLDRTSNRTAVAATVSSDGPGLDAPPAAATAGVGEAGGSGRGNGVDAHASGADALGADALGADASGDRTSGSGGSAASSEVAALTAALAATAGNKTAAARRLGLPRSTFFSKLKKHGLA